MKKITLLISAQSKLSALKQCRKQGILHIQHIQPPQNEDIDSLIQQRDQAEKALALISQTEEDQKTAGKADPADTVQDILDIQKQILTCQSQLQEKYDTRKWYESWGEISPASLATLREHGVYTHFYITDATGMRRIPSDASVQIVREKPFHLVYFADSEEEKLELKEIFPPENEPDELRRDIQSLQREIRKMSKKMASMKKYSVRIRQYILSLQKKIEFSRVASGMGEAEDIVILQGYIPVDEVDGLKKTADSEGWGYIIQDPEDPAQVPTLLRNTKIPRMIEPLFEFMGILPGYHEMDVSFVFLLFFSVFYAMIIGDAGYGLVFLGLTAFFRVRNKRAPAEPFRLFYVLSVTTIIWGVLTGTWFGSRTLADWPPLRKLVIEPMFSFNDSRAATKFMMRFSFFLGLIHLMIAHFLASLKKRNSLKALAEWGWILICAGMFFMVDFLVLSNPMPPSAAVLMFSGIILVGLFTNFQKHPLKMVASFIGTVLNSIQSVISAFSDIVSYIRLFAVGLAGVTVAASFNDMAGGILAPVVLILGHGLNIVLGMMSVMVHGVRLNMLEFSGHLGQEWSGRPYKPFKE